jgi:hypothetical protein
MAAFARAKYFAINVLTADQRELSQRFSSTVADNFDGVGAVSGHGGIPLINGCAFDCANVRNGRWFSARKGVTGIAELEPSLCFADPMFWNIEVRLAPTTRIRRSDVMEH